MTDFTETRSMLKKMAMNEDGDTPIRRAAHNLLEMTENWAKTTTHGADTREQIMANIVREMARLDTLLSQSR